MRVLTRRRSVLSLFGVVAWRDVLFCGHQDVEAKVAALEEQLQSLKELLLRARRNETPGSTSTTAMETEASAPPRRPRTEADAKTEAESEARDQADEITLESDPLATVRVRA